jgi:aerobic C4-dicarboxylate transport protein
MMHSLSSSQPWYRILYVQVIIAMLAGISVGYFAPEYGMSLKPLGDAVIKLIKMVIAPIIFCTVVHGIASVGDMRRLGRVGIKSLVYFEVVSTLALVIGLVVVNLLKPGAGIDVEVDPEALKAVEKLAERAHSSSPVDFFLDIIPNSFVGAFVSDNLLQVLVVSVLVAFAIAMMNDRGKPVLHVIEQAGQLFFGVMQIIVRAAPIGAFGVMAFAIGKYGIAILLKLLMLMVGFYITSGLFVVVVLGLISWWCGFSIFRFLYYIKDELLLVLGTSSSETALPSLIQKLQKLGCSKSTVGLVVPTGYSFNLDGTNIYMAMAAIFLAQANNLSLSLYEQLSLLVIAMITSKGASGVTGAGFVALIATLQAVPTIPFESVALLFGIDRFMSECRALTNFIGNGVATVAISRWENEVTAEQIRTNLQLLGTGRPEHKFPDAP